MSFYTSLSGLQAAQTDMATISHNIANVGTNGFKRSRSEFGDVMAATFTSAPRSVVGSGTVLPHTRHESVPNTHLTPAQHLAITRMPSTRHR